MTPAARVQAAIEILTAVRDTAQPIDRFLREWFRTRRYAGSKDRAAVAERVYDVFRHRASYEWRMSAGEPRILVIASLLSQTSAEQVRALFSGGTYAPAPLNDGEIRAMDSPRSGEAPLWVQGEFPQWLEPELSRSLGGDLLLEMQAMQSRAPVDLRVNVIKAARDEVIRELKSLGFNAAPTLFAPFGIRLDTAAGLNALRETELFRNGAFEFQDEASQIVARLVAARPGEQILDFASGAGGKSLAVAADMENRGEIIAHDVSAERMKELTRRAARAGATIIRPVTGESELTVQHFDAVLVDAPCSGTGTWRRNPDAKWRLTPGALARYCEVQRAIITDAARFVRPGGRLIYATCSLLGCENEDIVADFLPGSDFRQTDIDRLWSTLFARTLRFRSSHDFRSTPLATGADGFFASIMVRDNAKSGASE